MTYKTFFLAAIFTVGILFAISTPVSADIVIENASFELPSIGDGTTTSGFGGWARSGGAGSAISVLNPLDAQFSGSTGGAVPGTGSGDQVVVIGGGTGNQLWQDVGTIEADANYELTVAIGERLDLSWSNLSVDLRANSMDGTLLAGNVYTAADAPDGTFSDMSFSFNSADFAGEVGNSLFVVFTGSGNQSVLDNVRVTETFSAVPEPSSLAFLGLGMTFLLCRRRAK